MRLLARLFRAAFGAALLLAAYLVPVAEAPAQVAVRALIDTAGIPRLCDLLRSTNLQVCLDAGDGASYSSGQSWLDRSGNGYDFFRGTDGTSTATDPTFNGTAGNLSRSEYWSFDGGDDFRYDSTNETWMQSIHKDNAIVSIVMWVYPASVAANQGLLGDNGGDANTGTGFHFRINSTATVSFWVGNGGSDVISGGGNGYESTGTLSTNTWQMVSMSINEATGANGLTLGVNTTFSTHTSTYVSPSTGNASQTVEIASRGNASSPLASGSRLGMVAVWSGTALTQAEITSIYNRTKGRFGL